jgi:prepilin-type N-terminal cleavage/methylation domain-containing protein
MMHKSKVHPSSLRFARLGVASGEARAEARSPKSKAQSRGLKAAVPRCSSIVNRKSQIVNNRAFTLVEVMVVAAMLGLIVLALMAVFNGTQTAFRAGITQTGVQESGRAVMDLVKSDLEGMTPSFGTNNGAVNFSIYTNFYVAGYTPLFQALPAAAPATQRINVLESFFILSRGNLNGSDRWIGVGYSVMGTNSQNDLYPLYRFTTNYPVMTVNPEGLFYTNFYNFLIAPTNYSHLIDGVVHLRVRAFDSNGALITNNFPNTGGSYVICTNYLPSVPGEVGLSFYSNALPSSVEVELGVLEDRTLQRAESLPNVAQLNYLSNHVGQVHVFRQRVWIRNVDPSAY